MPNSRMAKAKQTRFTARPCGIIPVPALWPLCRYRHKGHWTGHKTRLDRSLTTKFGTVDYAREELVAELATAFVCASLGIVPTVRHADYIGNWLQVLKEDARAIIQAASLASKASDFILQFQAQTAQSETQIQTQPETQNLIVGAAA